MKVLLLMAIGAAGFTSVPLVTGHAYTVDPAAQWTQGYPSNGYGSTIDRTIFGAVDADRDGYGANGSVNLIKANLATKGGGSLGAFIAKNQKLYSNKVDPDCGLTMYDENKRSKLPAEIEYSGFTHPGPCEIWCDDTKVIYNANCQDAYPAIPAKIKFDKAKCAKANRMTVYWIAVHSGDWQVYTTCMWLEGGSGKGKPPAVAADASSTVAQESDTGSSTPATEPASGSAAETTSTPVVEPTSAPAAEQASAPAAEPTSAPAAEPTSAPASSSESKDGGNDEASAPPVETPTSATPPATPPASTPSSSKCTRRH